MAGFERLVARFVGLVLNRRRTVLAFTVMLTLFFSLGLGRLYFMNQFTSWLDHDDPVSSLFIELSREFAINELVVVVVESPVREIDQGILSGIADFSREIQNLEEVSRVTSLSTMVDISADLSGDLLVRDLLEVAADLSPEEFLNYLTANELYRNQVISANRKLAMVSVFIKGESNSEEVLQQMIMPLARRHFPEDVKLHFSGMPANAHYLNLYSLQDIKILSPLIVLLIALILVVSFRSWPGLLYPLLTVSLAAVWTFGLIGFSGLPLTFVTAIIPVLLVALGSAYGIHLVNRYRRLDPLAADYQAELRAATGEIFVPVLLAGTTTLIGFLSFSTAGLTLIANFGVFAACGIAFAMFISLTLLPVLASWFPARSGKKTGPGEIGPAGARIVALVLKHRRPVFFSCLLLILFCLLFVSRIRREVNFLEYFPRDSQAYIGNKVVEQDFQGAMPVICDIRAADVRSPEMLRLVRSTENYLLAYPGLSRPFSLASLLGELNFQLNGRFALPDTEAGVGNLWFFIEGRGELEQILNPDDSRTLVFSRFSDPRTPEQKRLRDYLESWSGRVSAGFFSFSPAQTGEFEAELRRLERDNLALEAAWLLKAYSGRDVFPEELLPELEAFYNEPLKNSEELEYGPQLLADYFDSSELDFDISFSDKERILNALNNLLSSGEFSREEVFEAMSGLLAVGIDEADLAFLADTLVFKVEEAGINRRVERAALKLFERYGLQDENLQKRISSILHDLLDDLAVLPDPGPLLAGLGRKMEFSLVQSGMPALMSRLDDSLFKAQVQSLALAYGLTLVLMILIYRDFLLGLLATAPIVFTVSVVYGFLGIFNMNLDYATMLTGAVAIGVGIDYAIHFLHSSIIQLKREVELEDALAAAMADKAPAILTNAFSVLTGFAVLLFSSMLILRNFGATMIAAMMLAAFATLVFLPAALLVLRRFLTYRRNK